LVYANVQFSLISVSASKMTPGHQLRGANAL